MQTRPITTLFMLSSLDGKISTGASSSEDFDKDLPHLKGVAEGLHQYYDLEKETEDDLTKGIEKRIAKGSAEGITQFPHLSGNPNG